MPCSFFFGCFICFYAQHNGPDPDFNGLFEDSGDESLFDGFPINPDDPGDDEEAVDETAPPAKTKVKVQHLIRLSIKLSVMQAIKKQRRKTGLKK